MAGKFINIAKSILGIASEGGLHPKDVPDTIRSAAEGNINCYPGEPAYDCYPLAVFVALHGKLKRGRWPYDFEGILQVLVQHVQGSCPYVTRDIVLISDSWWAPNFEKWQANIRTLIKSGINIEVYLISYPDLVNRLWF